jgi:hypothetical protein
MSRKKDRHDDIFNDNVWHFLMQYVALTTNGDCSSGRASG